jgi:hypothetical protein
MPKEERKFFDSKSKKCFFLGYDDENQSIHGCHKGRIWRKITVRTSARVRVYPADAVLPTDGFLPSADAVKIASARTHSRPHGHERVRVDAPMSARTLGCIRADAAQRPRGHGRLRRRISLPSPLLSLPPLCYPRGREKKFKNIFYF